jgi:hypothetical protein
MPLHDHPCYGVVLCPFGLPAGMHAEAAWNTVSVVDLNLSVGGGGFLPRPPSTRGLGPFMQKHV